MSAHENAIYMSPIFGPLVRAEELIQRRVQHRLGHQTDGTGSFVDRDARECPTS